MRYLLILQPSKVGSAQLKVVIDMMLISQRFHLPWLPRSTQHRLYARTWDALVQYSVHGRFIRKRDYMAVALKMHFIHEDLSVSGSPFDVIKCKSQKPGPGRPLNSTIPSSGTCRWASGAAESLPWCWVFKRLRCTILNDLSRVLCIFVVSRMYWDLAPKTGDSSQPITTEQTLGKWNSRDRCLSRLLLLLGN